MKVVVFAHTPPPFHGQSYMVQLLLDGLRQRAQHGETPVLEVMHVDAKLSDSAGDVGEARFGKFVALLHYCWRALRFRWREQAEILYYIPSPPNRTPLYRDWIVMALCRFAFPKLVLHWHAVGLGEWLHSTAWPIERAITRWLLGRANVSIVLSEYNKKDAELLKPRQIAIVPNGIPDPCPDFLKSIWPQRYARAQQRMATGNTSANETTFQLLFLGTCTSEKGLFASIDAVAITNQLSRERGMQLRITLAVAGEFLSVADRKRFQDRIERSDLIGADGRACIQFVGFVTGTEKDRLLREADCLIFPTQYRAEAQPLCVIEALAYGLPVIATRWRALPEMLEHTSNILTADQNPSDLADAILQSATVPALQSGRERFLDQFEYSRFISRVMVALSGLTVGERRS